MIKKYKIFEKYLNELKLEEYPYLIEGIDINKEERLVSFNKFHEDNVDTSELINPTYTNLNGINVISIFKRKKSEEFGYDGNPLIYALKNLNGWKFNNEQKDIINLLKQFIKITRKIDSKYDTIITIPSGNELNIKFLHRLNKIIKADFQITDYLYKMDAEDVFYNYLDWKQLKDDYEIKYPMIEKKLNKFFYNMSVDNNDSFSFKFIKDVELRKYIVKTIYSDDEKTIEYANQINNKNILILDDTIGSGKTISEVCKIITDTYVPKSITVITLFSKL